VDERRGAFGGVQVGSDTRALLGRFGPPAGGSPSGDEDGGPSREFSVEATPAIVGGSAAPLKFFQYPDGTFYAEGGRVTGFSAKGEDAETLRGVGVGDSLDLVPKRYPGMTCDQSETEFESFPYCSGNVSGYFVWFGEDPIKSITLQLPETQ
jgi:hypothetical protein